MPIASGANARLALKKETTLGTAATGNYELVPLRSYELSPSQAFIDSRLVGQGRDPVRSQRDVTELTGRAVIPIDSRCIGFWMTMCFGAPVTTGTGPYTHVWKSGATALVGYSIEAQFVDITRYELATGVIVQGWNFDMLPNGELVFNLDLMALSHAKSGTSAAGTPTSVAVTQFSQFQGSVLKDAVALAKIVRAPLNFRNNHELVRYVGGAGAIGDIAPGGTTSGGQLIARFADASLDTVADAQTLFDLQHVFQISGSEKITFELDQAEIASASAPIDGPGGIERTFELRGSKDPVEGQMMTVTLINDRASY